MVRLRWWSDPRQWLRALLMLDDTPHHIALGTALGVFIAFTPTVGIQMILVLLLAMLVRPFFRFNNVAGLIAVYITNPVTVETRTVDAKASRPIRADVPRDMALSNRYRHRSTSDVRITNLPTGRHHPSGAGCARWPG